MTDHERREAHVEALLERMSLDQKIGQMTQPERMHITPDEVKAYHIGSVLSGGGSWPGENRPSDWVAMNDAYWAASTEEDAEHLGIPILYGVDAVHGHNNVLGAVLLPHNIGLGAANDPDLARRIARAIVAHPLPVVLKADGLAAGKGVLICETEHEAVDGLRHILQDGAFGADVRRDFQPCRGLVIEAGEANRSCFGLEQQAREDGYWRPRRQRSGCPCDGFCQDVPFDSKLHGRVPPFIAAASC